MKKPWFEAEKFLNLFERNNLLRLKKQNKLNFLILALHFLFKRSIEMRGEENFQKATCRNLKSSKIFWYLMSFLLIWIQMTCNHKKDISGNIKMDVVWENHMNSDMIVDWGWQKVMAYWLNGTLDLTIYGFNHLKERT